MAFMERVSCICSSNHRASLKGSRGLSSLNGSSTIIDESMTGISTPRDALELSGEGEAAPARRFGRFGLALEVRLAGGIVGVNGYGLWVCTAGWSEQSLQAVCAMCSRLVCALSCQEHCKKVW